jgi:hypothetical protein
MFSQPHRPPTLSYPVSQAACAAAFTAQGAADQDQKDPDQKIG